MLEYSPTQDYSARHFRAPECPDSTCTTVNSQFELTVGSREEVRRARGWKSANRGFRLLRPDRGRERSRKFPQEAMEAMNELRLR